MGDELNNPDSTWLDNKFDVFSVHEDSANNSLQLILITLALILAIFIKSENRKWLFSLVFSIVLGFIIYSLLLKWQVWASRLQLPLLCWGVFYSQLCFPGILIKSPS